MKQFGIILLLFAFMGTLFAAKVELQDAGNYAVNAYYQKLNLYYETVNLEQVQIVETFNMKRNGESVYYIFNMENWGYIIISAEDVLNPVQAYSFDNHYVPDNHTDNFTGWLNGRAGAVTYARDNKIQATEEISAKWNALKDAGSLSLIKGGKSIEPLLTQTWNQDWPENYYMPLDPSGPGGRCLVGCVATAMSMIMDYWRYPLQGSGQKTHSFGGYPAITVNFGDTDYDWDAMLDNSDGAINLPMAEISMHAAVSVNMEWGPNSSGAYSEDVPPAMKNYFNYNPTCYLSSNQGIGWTTWKNYIEMDLDASCPLYFAGTDAQWGGSGHAFVCDGYNSDEMYHFNFGWSGSGNGWFDITSPAGYQWYYNQRIIRFLWPADDNYPYGCAPDYERTTLTGSFEDGSGPMEDYDQDASCSWLINPQTVQDSVEYINLEFVLLDTDINDIITIYDGPTTSDPVLGSYSGDMVPTGIVPSSGNQMLVTFETNGDGTVGLGWKVQYFSVQPEYCSSSPVALTAPTGTISDGSSDFWYNNTTNCMWQVMPAYASGVTLTFTAFETEETEDFLQVYDASNNQLLGEFSGNTLPDPIHAESGELFLIWKTNGVITGPGWEAYWEADNVGIEEEFTVLNNLMVYPIPALESLTISFSTIDDQSFDIRLLSMTGKVIYEENTSQFTGDYLNTIDLGNYAKGIYFLNITGKKGIVNRKVVVK